MFRTLALSTLGVFVFVTSARAATENVIVVTLDGFRWQELFHGADESLLDKGPGGVRDVDGLKNRYWRASPEERRLR